MFEKPWTARKSNEEALNEAEEKKKIMRITKFS
jgi:hypothetical protein